MFVQHGVIYSLLTNWIFHVFNIICLSNFNLKTNCIKLHSHRTKAKARKISLMFADLYCCSLIFRFHFLIGVNRPLMVVHNKGRRNLALRWVINNFNWLFKKWAVKEKIRIFAFLPSDGNPFRICLHLSEKWIRKWTFSLILTRLCIWIWNWNCWLLSFIVSRPLVMVYCSVLTVLFVLLVTESIDKDQLPPDPPAPDSPPPERPHGKMRRLSIKDRVRTTTC